MRIAYFSPLNPVKSGISDYSEELLPYLAEFAEVEIFVDGYQPENTEITRRFAVYDQRKFRQLDVAGRYDAVVYHMGNSPAHMGIYDKLLERPGIVVMHDYVLHHLIVWMAAHRGRRKMYLEKMRSLGGPEAENLARQVLYGQLPKAMFDYPLSEDVIKSSQGVIVHSQYARDKVRAIDPSKPVQLVNMGMPLPQRISKAEARRRLGLNDSTFIISSFGHMNPYKRIDAAIRAFRCMTAYIPDAKFLLIGSTSPNYDPGQTIRMLGLNDRVTVHGFAQTEDFWNYVFASDVCLNLRYPTAGETSAAALRLMAAGRPVIVSNTGAFMELPGSACIKVDVDDAEEEEILENLLLLARMPALADAIGYNGRSYIASCHTLAGAAAGYIEFVSQLTGKEPDRPVPADSRANLSKTPALCNAEKPVSRPQPLRPVVQPGVRQDVEAASAPPAGSQTRNIDYAAELASEAAALGVTEDDTDQLRGIARVIAETLGPHKR